MSTGLATTTETEQRITGCVKWFNNKAGFGFVTACEGALKDKDVFVHYSSINVPDDQYKYLVQGEYVDFELTESEKDDHEFHAVKISGVKGGNLMCETRKLALETSSYKPRVYKTPDASSSSPRASATEKAPAKRKYVKRDSAAKEDDGFTKVPSRKPKNAADSSTK